MLNCNTFCGYIYKVPVPLICLKPQKSKCSLNAKSIYIDEISLSQLLLRGQQVWFGMYSNQHLLRISHALLMQTGSHLCACDYIQAACHKLLLFSKHSKIFLNVIDREGKYQKNCTPASKSESESSWLLVCGLTLWTWTFHG